MSETETISQKTIKQTGPFKLGWRVLLLRCSAAGLLAILFVGLFVRLSVRDARPVVGAIFYALPWPVLAAIAWLAAFAFRRLHSPQIAGLLRVSAPAILLLWCLSAWQIAPNVKANAKENAKSLRVVFWNTCRGWGGWDGLARELKKQQSDLIGLVESGLSHQQIARHWKPHFADRNVRYLGRGMTIIIRGEIGQIQDYTLSEGSHAYAVFVNLDDQIFVIIICDIRSTPWRSREAPLRRLAEIVSTMRDQPVIVMGDFNTPIDSLHLRPIQAQLDNVFVQVGNGLYVTWPLPLPVHALDQIWVNTHFAIQSAQLGWSWRSDHRPVITDLQTDMPAQTQSWDQPLQSDQP